MSGGGEGGRLRDAKESPSHYSLLPPNPSHLGSRMEPDTVATDPRIRVVQQEHRVRKREQVLISPSPFFKITHSLAWFERDSEYSLGTLLTSCWKKKKIIYLFPFLVAS